jgi:hypothetical protein
MKASDRYRVPGAACLVDGRRLAVANLSVGGLFAITDRPPITGQVLTLQLALPAQPPLQISGQVTWVNESAGLANLPPGFGVKITQISFLDKLTLLGFLRRAASPGSITRGGGDQ